MDVEVYMKGKEFNAFAKRDTWTLTCGDMGNLLIFGFNLKTFMYLLG